MKLNFEERMIILSILPKEGSIITIRLIRELISKLATSAKEIEEFGIQKKEEGVVFNEKARVPIEFEFNEVEIELVRGSLKELDNKKQLVPDMISVWEKFC